jgi:hypothetical protein
VACWPHSITRSRASATALFFFVSDCGDDVSVRSPLHRQCLVKCHGEWGAQGAQRRQATMTKVERRALSHS